MSIFDLDEHPENLAVIVLVAAGVLFFLCIYCSFVRPVINCMSTIFHTIIGICCISRTRIYSAVGGDEV